MNTINNNNNKLKLLENDSIYLSLSKINQAHLSHLSYKYNFSYQELRQLAVISADFSMWNEKTLDEYVADIEKESGRIVDKKYITRSLNEVWNKFKNSKIRYDAPNKKSAYRPEPRKIQLSNESNDVYGNCPVASDKTVCCNLMTIDAVQGCSLGCSYCSIQTFYSNGKVVVDKNLAEKLSKIPLDPNKKYHIGSGQSSDSLAIGNKEGVLEAQLDFARNNPNIILEFKTKSKNISYLLEADVPKNVFISWSLNPQKFIDNEEHGTANIEKRISSARAMSDKGVLIGFHFHPIVYYEGYELDYKDIIDKVMSGFHYSEIAMISMGTLTFIKPAIKKIRSSGLNTKVLQIPMDNAVGKSSYTKEIKSEIFSHVYNQFSNWHDKVFFYLCMEERSVWDDVFGGAYDTNKDFEDALFGSVTSKMNYQYQK